MKVCTRCGAQCADDVLFCGSCGSPLPQAAPGVPGVPGAPGMMGVPGAPTPVRGTSPAQAPQVPIWGAAQVPQAAQVPMVPPVPQQAPTVPQTPAAGYGATMPQPPQSRPSGGTQAGGAGVGAAVVVPDVSALRAARVPLVLMLVGAVFGMLYTPLTLLGFALFPGSPSVGGMVFSSVVNGLGAGLTLYMALALLLSLTADGRRVRGNGLVPAFVVTVLYMVCVALRSAMPDPTYVAATILLGVGLCVMTVLLLVASSRAKADRAGAGIGGRDDTRAGVLIVFVVSIVTLLADVFDGVAHGLESEAWLVGSNLYSALNALMLLIGVFLPMMVLGGRLRRATGTGWHIAPLAGLVIGAVLQVASVWTAIAGQQLLYRLRQGRITTDEYSRQVLPFSGVGAWLGVTFFLVVLVVVIVMLVGVSKASRGASVPSVPSGVPAGPFVGASSAYPSAAPAAYPTSVPPARR
ncbi:zinc ribbon domain-containing protein [Bifidobacterium saguinibicoloris]|uniref:zinc ribbon domain-containing protein n=1 Tax=Bifidobacterium saguinibicoloris TaxID=2834433 RepID=UPI001C576A4F|nr:zinc ribbon domain-containing protein [Bifidobacterium saguinibicoloris]MBW3080305.1 hypothetical protein [Bifidobacterium saguinibicoloris]